jgi:hypothetical protein
MSRNAWTVALVFTLAWLVAVACHDTSSAPTSPSAPEAPAASVPAGFKLVPENYVCTAPTPPPVPCEGAGCTPTPRPTPTPEPSPTPSPKPTPSPTPPPERFAFCHVSNKGAAGGDHNVQEQTMFAEGVIPPGHVAHFSDPKFCPKDYVGECDGRSLKVVCP